MKKTCHRRRHIKENDGLLLHISHGFVLIFRHVGEKSVLIEALSVDVGKEAPTTFQKIPLRIAHQ